MTETVSLMQIRAQLDEAVRVLRLYSQKPDSPYYLEYQNALCTLDNIALALYVRTVAPTAVEVLDVKTVQDLDVTTARRVRGA